MIETFNSHGWRDFSQRYHDVYGYFPKENGGEVLVKVVELDSKTIKFVDDKGVTYYGVADKGVQFKFIPVIKKLFLHEDKLHLATRVPARQYKRGICEANTQVTELAYNRHVDLTFDVIKSYNTVAPKHKVANSIFGFSGRYVYLYNNVIGFIENNKILLEQHMFKQELFDAIRDNKLTYSVELA